MSRSDSITTSVEHHGDVTLLIVGGVVDLATAPALEEAVDALIAAEPTALIVDLSAVTFLASVGLRILVTIHDRVSESSAFAVVANAPATVRPIQLTHVDELFSLYPTVDDALVSVRNG